MANTSGVFTLDQLRALGQTGDLTEDLTAGDRLDYLSNIKALEEFRRKQAGVDALRAKIPASMKAGYYQIPGQQGAEYYDPAAGNASEALAQYLATGKDQFGAPSAPVDGGDTGDAHRQSTEQGLARRVGSIFHNASAQGIPIQDAAGQLNNTGKYQKYVIGPNGEHISMDKVAGMQTAQASRDAKEAKAPNVLESHGQHWALGGPVSSGNPYGWQQVSDDVAASGGPQTDMFGGGWKDYTVTQAGAFNNLMEKMGVTEDELLKNLGLENNGYHDANTFQADKDSLAANFYKNALKQKGLREHRAALGLNPETGISATETRRISETYWRISDPSQRAAYIKYQDPGNLTAPLRLARIDARAGVRDFMAKYKVSQPVWWEQASNYKEGLKGQVKTTYGDIMQTDVKTGRDTLYGNIPIAKDYVAPKKMGGEFGKFAESDFSKRMSGAVWNSVFGFIFGGPIGAVMGAYMGAGGPMPNAKNISFKDVKGLGDWRAGRPMSMDQIWNIKSWGEGIAFAAVFKIGAFGDSAKWGKAAVMTPKQRAGLFLHA